MRILLIEDDAMIGRAVRSGLEQAEFGVDWFTDGRHGQSAVRDVDYDAIVLDIGLPHLDGLSLLRDLRSRARTVPVLIISARDAVADRISALDIGADDYLPKPFDLGELVARLRALLRRQPQAASQQIAVGPLNVDLARRVATIDGRELKLTATEFAILEALIRRPGAVLSRERLEASVYAWNDEIASNAIEVHLHNLRRKLGHDLIRNVRGVGYRIAE